MHKEAWIFTQANYEKVKQKTGYQWLGNLPATKDDAANAKMIAMGMGILEPNIFHITDKDVSYHKSFFQKKMIELRDRNIHGKRSFLMVYVSGHGVWDNRQHYVLNVDTEVNMISIERLLRAIASESITNVLVFYDSCRSEKSG